MFGVTHTVNPGELVIGAANALLFVNPTIGGETKKCGTVPQPDGWRSAHVRPMHAVQMPNLIPESEWADRIKEKVATRSQLSDVWKRGGPGGGKIPSRDQNGKGYCWAHSGVSAHLALRALMNLPYVDLSAYSIAATIKRFRDEGGWGAQGLDFQTETGCCDSSVWPQQSMDRSLDLKSNPTTQANAAKHKVTGGWIDLSAAQYDRNLTKQQVATCLLMNIPVIVDYNWWSHSVCALDLVLLPSGRIGIRIQNSWGDSWSDGGMGVLDDSKCWPDGATAPYSITAGAA